MIGLRLCIFGKNVTEVICPFHGILLGWITQICLIAGDFNLDLLVKMVSASFCYFNITIFPFVINKYLRVDALRLCKIFLCLQILTY